MKRWFFLGAALLAIGTVACATEVQEFGEHEQEGTCIPGETMPCACTDGSQGVQECAPSGDALSACICGNGSHAPAGTGGVPGASTGGFPPATGGVSSPSTGGAPIAGSGGVPTAGSGGIPIGGTGEGGFVEPGSGDLPPTAGTGGIAPPTGGAAPLPPGSRDPIIPPVTADCPVFANSTITFMGLPGIQIVAGQKPPGPTAPMVFYWHGTGSTAGEFAFMAAAVRDGVVAEGGVLVSFQGTTGGDLLSGTNIFGAGDFDLADQLLACAVRDHNVDPRRVFATGCSAGGLFSTAMAAMRSNYIAAAAPNSGGSVVPLTFQSDHTPALMTIHGAPGDDVVVVDFSNTSANADAAFSARGGFVINCNHGGGHCGGAGLAPDIWEFFKAHPYGVDPEPWAGGLPAGFNSSCVIY